MCALTCVCVCVCYVSCSQVLRENELLRREVEVKESKLSSSMNSIKTFWSPELKKERALRKDEVSKITVWKEQYRVIQDETQVCDYVITYLLWACQIDTFIGHILPMMDKVKI